MRAPAVSQKFLDRFLKVLREQAKESPSGKVSSAALEGALGWKRPNLFERAKQQLQAEKQVRVSAGGGGGVLEPIGAEKPPPPRKINAFISYSHRDKETKAQLLKHLTPLTRRGLIDHWHDGEIKVGDEWEKEILDRLGRADLIVLLISVDFIGSSYCYDVELGNAFKRLDAKKAKIVPVIVRNCLWEDLPFGKIQAALKGRAVTDFTHADDALTEVAREIRDLVMVMRDPATKAAA